MKLIASRLAASAALLVFLAACEEAAHQVMAQEPGNDTVCALDGMVLKDYPGPKAQIHYAEGAPEFFCDLMELFATVFVPETKRPIAGMFVQDMGKTAWEHPEGHWIDAKTAIYVVGSQKSGSMGQTFGSFSSVQDAEAFAKKEGGNVVKFQDITPAMAGVHAGAGHDQAMH